MMSSVESYRCKQMLLGRGVGIGSNRKLSEKLGTSARISVKQIWLDAGALGGMEDLEEMSDTYIPLRSAVWRGEVFRPGDHVVVLVDGSSDETHPQNWKAVLRKIFVHEFNGRMEILFEADWYRQQYAQDPKRKEVCNWERDEYSQFTLLEPKLTQAHGNNCRPLSRIVHKFFPIRRGGVGGGGREIVALEIGDTLCRDLPGTIGNCPPFPEVGDIMRVFMESSGSTVTELCVVREVILPRTEFQAEDEALSDDSDVEEQAEELEARDIRTGNDPNNGRGVVGVSWLTVYGLRSSSPTYKAGVKLDSHVQFQSLVEIMSDFTAFRWRNGLPVAWHLQPV